MPCWKCSAELQGAKKFCGQCGAAVASGVDPFASTVQPNAKAVPRAPGSAPASVAGSPSSALPASRVSPLASSGFQFAESLREIVVAADAAASAAVVVDAPAAASSPERGVAGTLQMQQVPSRVAPAAPVAPVAPAAPGVAPTPPTPPTPGPASVVAGAALGPGATVRVRWANGQKYAGTVWQVHGTQVLVAFQDGQRHWVEASFVERA